MKYRVLIVDDNRMNLVIATKILKNMHIIDTVSSGKEVFEYLENNKPDLILLDVMMPEMDGLEVIAKLRANINYCKIPVIFLTSDKTDSTEQACFDQGAVDFISKPFIPTILIKRVQRTLELDDYRKNLETLVKSKIQKISQLQTDIIITLANIIESRDGTTGEHVKRTSYYVKFIADKLRKKGFYTKELTDEFIDILFKAAPMHDIGKITIPDYILQKQGKLTPEEYSLMKNHAKAGGEIIKQNISKLEELKFVQVAYDMATYHHEKWNGLGYPDGLKGFNIPLAARILAVADVFDALVAKRVYKDGMTIDEAFAIMEKGRGTDYETCIFDAFIEAKDELNILMKELSN
ncbi:MAG: HD domain-containing phosphohydrolase [Succinivibrionaceae bacterium]